DTPVVANASKPRDRTAAELWMIHAGSAQFRRGVSSGAPDEWTSTTEYELAGPVDLDGDGVAESIVVEEQSHPAYARYTVTLDGRRRELPGAPAVPAADGPRDGIVRLRPFSRPAGPPAPCPPSAPPDACSPGPPPQGWWPVTEGSWDWEHQPPQILVWRGGKL